MKVLIITVAAEMVWLALAVSGPVWALWLGFAGCALSPAVVITFHERGRELDQRIASATDVVDVLQDQVTR